MKDIIKNVNVVREIYKNHDLYHKTRECGKIISLLFVGNILLLIYFLYDLLDVMISGKPLGYVSLVPIVYLFYVLRRIRKEIQRLI